jgi:hypothetical protein
MLFSSIRTPPLDQSGNREVGGLVVGRPRRRSDQPRHRGELPPTLTRMADFVAWVSAADPALGWYPGDFLKAYMRNREGERNPFPCPAPRLPVHCSFRKERDRRGRTVADSAIISLSKKRGLNRTIEYGLIFRGQVLIRCLPGPHRPPRPTGRKPGKTLKKWCGRRDSNPHSLRGSRFKSARITVVSMSYGCISRGCLARTCRRFLRRCAARLGT